MLNLKSILNDNMRVKFDFYRDGALWYSTMNGFQFPVPVKTLAGTTILKLMIKHQHLVIILKNIIMN